MQKQILLISLIVLTIAIGFYFLTPANGIKNPFKANTSSKPSAKTNLLVIANKRFLLNVTLHTENEINALLTRAETLSKRARHNKKDVGIALILHGPEVGLFTKKNYQKFKALVDKAKRLDREKVIDIKICRTQMHSMKIKDTDIPSFIEIVPYGPDEQERLLKQGYINL